jgi:hypothetical protein
MVISRFKLRTNFQTCRPPEKFNILLYFGIYNFVDSEVLIGEQMDIRQNLKYFPE